MFAICFSLTKRKIGGGKQKTDYLGLLIASSLAGDSSNGVYFIVMIQVSVVKRLKSDKQATFLLI